MEQIQQPMAELRAGTMELVTQSIGDNTVGQNEACLKAMPEEIQSLHDILVSTGSKMALKIGSVTGWMICRGF